jgi:hypothetical protein
MKLRKSADVAHETARDWYDGYGAYVRTESASDV